MKTYLVRAAGTTKVLGIFWAATPADLSVTIEEMDDPAICEYAVIEASGGIWHDVPMIEVQPTGQIEDGEDEPHILHPLTIASQNFLDDLMGQGRMIWQRFSG